jgi:pimeloyl-ACP methyl ester carboxylesterase
MTRTTGLIVALLLLLAAPLAMLGATPAGGDPDYAAPGPYGVDVRDVHVARPGLSERFGARLFVPLPDGEAGGGETSPIFAFGHGFLAPVDVYSSTLEHLASWGITVVAPRSGGGLLASHDGFAADLVAALDHVATAASADDWHGLPVDGTARSVGGHSMGGGAAVLAASLDPGIRTLATLSAADTRPSAVLAAGAVEAPMLLVAASEDRITPLDAHQRPIFEAAAGPAQLRVIEGGGHCGYLDGADLIGLVCGRASLGEEEQRAEGRAALTAWLRAQLMGDPAARRYIQAAGPWLTIESKGMAES